MTILFGIGLAGDMNPSGGTGTFPNQLIDVCVVHQPFEPFTVLFDAVEMDIGGFSCQVLTGGYSACVFVQGWTSVTAADPYGLANMLTQWLQYFATEGPLDIKTVATHRPIVLFCRTCCSVCLVIL